MITMLAALTVRLPRPTEAAALRLPSGRPRQARRMARRSPPTSAASRSAHALTDPRQWCLNVAWLLLGGLAFMVTVHIVPFARDQGISLAGASLALTAYGIGSVGGRVAAGAMSDRIGTITTMRIAYVVQALALLALLWLPSRETLFGSLAAFGAGFAAADTMIAKVIPDVFGVRAIGAIMGVLTLGWRSGAALGPAAAGFLYDVSGSYAVPFGAAPGVVLVSWALFAVATSAPGAPLGRPPALARGRVLAGQLGRGPFEFLLLPVEPRLPGPGALQVIAHVQTQPAQPVRLQLDLIPVLEGAEPPVVGARGEDVTGLERVDGADPLERMTSRSSAGGADRRTASAALGSLTVRPGGILRRRWTATAADRRAPVGTGSAGAEIDPLLEGGVESMDSSHQPAPGCARDAEGRHLVGRRLPPCSRQRSSAPIIQLAGPPGARRPHRPASTTAREPEQTRLARRRVAMMRAVQGRVLPMHNAVPRCRPRTRERKITKVFTTPWTGPA